MSPTSAVVIWTSARRPRGGRVYRMFRMFVLGARNPRTTIAIEPRLVLNSFRGHRSDQPFTPILLEVPVPHAPWAPGDQTSGAILARRKFRPYRPTTHRRMG